MTGVLVSPGGPAERQVRGALLRYAAGLRAAVTVLCLLLGLLLVPAPHRAPAIAGMLALAGWTLFYAVRLPKAPSWWLVTADVLALCAAALTQQWTVPDRAAADSTGWVLGVLTVAVVTVQWATRWPAGTLATLALFAAYLGGAWWSVGATELDRLVMILWLVPQAALSRGGAVALTRAARAADRMAATQEREQLAAAVGAARRADERQRQALLHDTVAATLLMVGAGAIAASTPALREQAARDLEVLRQTAPPVPADLGDLLRREVATSPVAVRHEALPALTLPAEVAAAVAGSVHEALTNVGRHAGVAEATLSVQLDPLRIAVTDRGRGFTTRPPHRYGVSRSIVARMADAGGRAEITSAPGEGTAVRLRWPDA